MNRKSGMNRASDLLVRTGEPDDRLPVLAGSPRDSGHEKTGFSGTADYAIMAVWPRQAGTAGSAGGTASRKGGWR